MFGISFNELLIVLVVALLFVRPKDLPSLARGYKNFIKSTTKFKRDIEQYFVDTHNKALDLDQENNERSDENLKIISLDKSGYVLDDEGKIHKSYDISEFKKKKLKK